MAYNVDFKALALWIGLAAVIAGGYFVITSDTSSPIGEESSLSLGIQQDEIKPGDTIRIEATNSEGPVEDVEINVNDEDIGDTNENGIAGYSVPENAEALNISGEHQGATATVEASLEDGEFNVDEGSDSSDGGSDSDEGDDSDSVSDGSDQNDGSNSGSEDDGDQNESGSGEDSTADSGDQNTDEETNDQDGGQDNQTDSPGSGDTGLELESSPVAEELNTVTLTKDGDSIADASVYVNNDEVGTTTSTGSLTFTVPNTQEITVSTDADIQSETFTVEGYTNETGDDTTDQDPEVLDAYYQYTPENPSIGDEIEFDASQTTGNNIQSYEWDFGEGSTGTGQTATNTYGSAGTYTTELTVTDEEGNTDSIDADITVEDQAESEGSDVFISQLSPQDSISGPEDTFSAYVEVPSSSDYEYELNVGQNTRVGPFSLNSGSNDISRDIRLEDSGSIDYTVLVTDKQTAQTYSETESINVGRAWGDFADFDYITPESSVDYNATLGADLINLNTDVRVSVDVDGAEIFSENLSQDNEDKIEHLHRFDSSGAHDWNITLVSDQGEIIYNDGEVQVDRKAPFVQFGDIQPSHKSSITSVGGEANLNATAKAYQDLTYEFYLNGSQAGSGDLVNNEEAIVTGSPNVEVGKTYEWKIEFKSGGETFDTNLRTFTVSGNRAEK